MLVDFSKKDETVFKIFLWRRELKGKPIVQTEGTEAGQKVGGRRSENYLF